MDSKRSETSDQNDDVRLCDSPKIIARINDSSDSFTLESAREEHIINFPNENLETLLGLVTLICENIECISEVIDRIDLTRMRLFFKNGVEIADGDLLFIRPGEIVYLDLLGNDFNEAQVLDQYKTSEQLYDGGHYKVYKITEIDTGDPYILKIINFEEEEREDQKCIEEFTKKLKILSQLEHRNICKYFNWFRVSNQVCLITEFSEIGKLQTYIDSKYGSVTRELEARLIVSQMLRCISYCHQKGVYHGSINPNNVYLSKNQGDKEKRLITTHHFDYFSDSDSKTSDEDSSDDFRNIIPKLGDFSTSEFYKTDESQINYLNPIYLPPEVVVYQKPKSTASTDVWSIGVILYLLIFGKLPYDKSMYKSKFNLSNTVLKFDQKIAVSSEVKEVIKCMLELDSKKRLPIYKILDLNWFKFSEKELTQNIQTIIDIRNALLKRKEKSRIKAALKGNKFINDEGKIVVMNRNLNKDLREDLIYQEYISESSDSESLIGNSSPISKYSKTFKESQLIISNSPTMSDEKANESIAVPSELTKKKRKISHIYITGKRTNFERVNKFYSENNPLMKSESNRVGKFLKPITKHKTELFKQNSIKTSYSKEISIEYNQTKSDSNYVNSSVSTQISGSKNSRMKSELPHRTTVANRFSFKDPPYDCTSRLGKLEKLTKEQSKISKIRRLTTMESKRLGNLRRNKLYQ